MNPLIFSLRWNAFTLIGTHRDWTITDPYANGDALGDRLKTEDSFWPFLHFFHPQRAFKDISASGRANLEILVFLTKFGGFHLWLINRISPGSTGLLWQTGLSLQQLNQLTILMDGKDLSQLLGSAKLQQTIPDMPAWAQAVISAACLSHLPLKPGEHQPATAEFLELLEKLFEFTHPSDYDQLLAEIKLHVEADVFEAIAQLFGSYRDIIAANNSTSVVMEGRHLYCILREIFCLMTGHHIVQDPLSGRHVTSLRQRSMASGPLSTRLMLYRSASNPTFFHEVRGSGWMDSSDAFIFPGGLSYELPSGSKFCGAGYFNREDLLAMIQHDFATADPRPTGALKPRSHRVVVSTVTGDVNLGHILWNEFSGLTNFATMIDQCRSLSLPPIQIYLPSHSQALFSHEGPRRLLGEKFKQTWHSLLSEQLTFIHEASQQFQDDDVAYVSFKAWLVSSKLMSMLKSMAADYQALHPELEIAGADGSGAAGRGLTILLNLRTRDKSCLNMDRCLDVALAKLKAGRHGLAYRQIRFFLDYVQPHEQIDACVNVLTRYGCQVSLAAGCAIDQLAYMSDRCDFAIVTVGSGAVVPTWFFRKPAIMHSEKTHMAQVHGGMWVNVAEYNRDDIYTFDTDADISEVGEGREGHQGAYCNYLLNEEVFASRFLQILDRVCQPLPAAVPA